MAKLLGIDNTFGSSKGKNIRAEELLTQLFRGNINEQLSVISKIGETGAPLLLRALLWKYAEENRAISLAVTRVLQPHLSKIKSVLWREAGSPIAQVRMAAVDALKTVIELSEFQKFLPLLDDYEVSVREKTREAIRSIVEKNTENINEDTISPEQRENLETGFEVIMTLALDPITSKRVFASEMILTMGIVLPRMLWRFAAETPGLDLSLLSGELVKQSNAKIRYLLYCGLLRDEKPLRSFALNTLNYLYLRESLKSHLHAIAAFTEPEQQVLITRLEKLDFTDRMVTKFDNLDVETQKLVLKFMKFTADATRSGFLEGCLSHDDPEIVLLASDILQEKAEGIEYPDLIQMTKSESEPVALKAMGYLAEQDSGRALNDLVGLLDSDSEKIAREAAKTIGIISERQLFSKFEKLGERATREITKIIHHLNPAFVGELNARLETMDRRQRVCSVRILLSLADEEEARKALEELMEDEDSHVRASAAKSVKHFSDDEVAGIVDMLLEDEDPRVRANTIEQIPDQVDRKVVEKLFTFTNSRHGRERANALKKLWEMGYQGYELSVARMVEDPDPFIRASGLWVIGEIDSPGLLGLAVDKIKDSQSVVRRNAVIAIKKRGTSDQVRQIYDMTRDSDEGVRAAAGEALKERLGLEVELEQ